jgi:hypothetical protein
VDAPEQALATCTRQNHCPICKVDPDSRGNRWDDPEARGGTDWLSEGGAEPRTPEDHLRRTSRIRTNNDAKDAGLLHVQEPFWKDLMCTNIFSGMFPDALHQLQKGVIFDHLFEWAKRSEWLPAIQQAPSSRKKSSNSKTSAKGPLKSDMAHLLGKRHSQLPPHPHTRIYEKKVLTNLKQTTGREQRNVIAQLSVVVQGLDPSLSTLVHLTANIYYMATYRAHTTNSLQELDSYIDDWFRAAEALFRLNIRSHLNVPKIHSLLHYVAAFRRFGACDNYNTETFERHHIDFMKNPYGRTNRRDYFPQIIKRLERDDKILAYWKDLFRKGLLPASLASIVLPSSFPHADNACDADTTIEPVDSDEDDLEGAEHSDLLGEPGTSGRGLNGMGYKSGGRRGGSGEDSQYGRNVSVKGMGFPSCFL